MQCVGKNSCHASPNRNAASKGSVSSIRSKITGYEMLGGSGNGPAGMKPGGSGNGPAGIKLTTGGSGNGPAGMKLGGSGNGPAGMKFVSGGSGNGPAGMKLGGSGNGPAGIKLAPGGNGNGPAGIAFAVQAVTTSNAITTTLRIFNLLVHMENSPGGGNPPHNSARREYPKRVMESTTKVLFEKILNLSNS